MAQPLGNEIVLIDRQQSWLVRSTQALRRAGFSVESLNHYNYPLPHDPTAEHPRLVVLGCATVGVEESQLIQRIVDHGDYLLVLSTSISSRQMRNIFLSGATDVTDKPYHTSGLVSAVRQVLDSLSPA